jgi:hypothetical protein
VWRDDLRGEIESQRRELVLLMETFRPLLARFTERDADPFEASAAASFLHSFYTGIETVLKRIAMSMGNPMTKSETWHRDLLDSMSRSAGGRPAVISSPLRNKLKEYLGFRHMYRQAYSHRMKWERMKPLALESEAVFRQFECELGAFLEWLELQEPDDRT